MKHGLWVVKCILGLVLPAVLLTGCMKGSGATGDRESKQSMMPADGQISTGESAPSRSNHPDPANTVSVDVVIDNFAFDPPKLTINAGTKVTWVNHDDVPHTATSSTKPRAFDSGTLDTDEKFSFVFTAPGTYDYFCAVHPKMTGQIIVK